MIMIINSIYKDGLCTFYLCAKYKMQAMQKPCRSRRDKKSPRYDATIIHIRVIMQTSDIPPSTRVSSKKMCCQNTSHCLARHPILAPLAASTSEGSLGARMEGAEEGFLDDPI